ncbi:flagellar motor switch protein FliN/FliY [Scopulibacillus daqui]|uniref:Flagellar motor switch protein FliN/FliY n=1 Tax=Scopulibacillus daqui TaxID=1469162 RepID=A0ABS2PWQ4_9BACL|nr:flagellar motor switch phosphatase FliY [Scopulibacillus daqui]MBM7644366.1 flagellar motor switch protein FliN/FliY [Scopulibacillus daqui]
MSEDGMLSQKELDALIDHTSDYSDENITSKNKIINEMEQEALSEILNMSFGSAAAALSNILNQKVEITAPAVSIVQKDDLEKEFPVPYVAVLVNYTEGFQGSNILMVKTRDACVMADLIKGGDGSSPQEEIGEMELNAFQKVMKQMISSSTASMSTLFDRKIETAPPTILKDDPLTSIIPDDDEMLKVSFHITVGHLIDSSMMQLIPIDFGQELANRFLNKKEEGDSAKDIRTESSLPDEEEDVNPGEQLKTRESDPGPAQTEQDPLKSDLSHLNVQAVALPEFDEETQQVPKKQNLELLFDIPLQVSVELGQTKKTIKEVLELSPGVIIELDKLAGEPVDILINHRPVAKGEVVVIDENFGVRITEIINQRDRLKTI